MAASDPISQYDFGKLHGFSPEDIARFLSAGFAIYDFLFGGGHAGSCGVFRDQYFQEKALLEPIMQEAARALNFGATHYHPTPNEVAVFIGPYLGPVLENADDQFDQFKGKNLLGQTMFASRLHLYFFRTLISIMGFGTAQWAQYRVEDLTRRDTEISQKLDWVEGRMTQAEWHIDQFGQLAQKVDWVEGRLTAAEYGLKLLWSKDIPALRADLLAQLGQLNNLLSPLVQENLRKLNDLLLNALPAIQEQFHGLDRSISDIRATYVTKKELEEVRQQLLDCCRANQLAITLLQTQQQGLLDQLAAHTAQIKSLQRQIDAIGQGGGDFATRADIARLQDQISVLVRQAAGFATLPQLAQLQGQVTAIQHRLPDFDAALATLRARLDALDTLVAQKAGEAEIAALQGQIAQLSSRLGELAPLAALQALAARVAQLESELPAVVRQGEFQALKAAVTALLQRATATEAILAQLQGQIDTIQANMRARDADLQQTQQELARLTQVVGLKADNAQVVALQQKLEALTAQVQSKADISQVVQLQRQMADLRATDTAQWQALETLSTQLATAQQAIQRLGEQLQLLQNQVVQLGTQVGQQLQQLQAVDAQLQGEIDVITQSLQQQVVPQIAALLQRVASLEQQKTGTVLPALQELGKGLGFLDHQLTQEVKPKLGQHDQRLADLANQIANVIGPQITNLEMRVTNLFVQVNTFVNARITKLEVFIQNIDNHIMNVVVANCDTLRKCIEQTYQDHKEALCEYGRRVWGEMAECWLSAFTPEQPAPYHFSRADSDARWGMIGQLQTLSGQGPTASHMGVNNSCHHLLFMTRASSVDAPVTLARITDTAEHIFVEAP